MSISVGLDLRIEVYKVKVLILKPIYAIADAPSDKIGDVTSNVREKLTYDYYFCLREMRLINLDVCFNFNVFFQVYTGEQAKKSRTYNGI